MVVAGAKVGKNPKTITFPWFSSTSPNWSHKCGMVNGPMKPVHMVLDAFISIVNDKKQFFRQTLFMGVRFGFFDFLLYAIFELSPPLNQVYCRLRSDSENLPQKKLCDFTSHPDSFYFDIIDRFGFPDHHLESKWGCINLLHWVIPLETSDSGSPTVGRDPRSPRSLPKK